MTWSVDAINPSMLRNCGADRYAPTLQNDWTHEIRAKALFSGRKTWPRSVWKRPLIYTRSWVSVKSDFLIFRANPA
jgi:hypothetical protein